MEKWKELMESIKQVCAEGEYTYKDVETAVGKLHNELVHKGRNLLDAAHIQEVLKMPMF